VADWNLAGTLAGAPTCERDSVTTIAVGNYYESSRLLLDKQWSDLAAKQGAVVVAAPSNDVLLVTCNPSPALLKKLAVAVQNTYPRAPHPISPSLWSWATGGWQELKLPQ
jgi:hypothetical protein